MVHSDQVKFPPIPKSLNDKFVKNVAQILKLQPDVTARLRDRVQEIGRWADAWGREQTTIWMMVISGACALSIGWLMDASAWLVVPLALVWGFTIVADSAQFSAVVTEVAPPDAVGTALTLQTSLGFALSAISIQVTSVLAASVGWRVAYGVLAIGPVLGIITMARLRAVRREAPAPTD